MPPSLPAGWTVTKRSNHSGAYQQLDAIGVMLGFPPRGAAALEFSVNGAACSLALSIDSGTVTGLDLSIKAEGPALASGPLISLRPETAFDRTGKERGIAREVQLGDEGFDAAVSVDSNATDAEVKRVLAAAGLRAAVQSLLRSGAEDLRIDSIGVRAHWKKSSECFLPERVLPVLESLLLVHRAGRPRARRERCSRAWCETRATPMETNTSRSRSSGKTAAPRRSKGNRSRGAWATAPRRPFTRGCLASSGHGASSALMHVGSACLCPSLAADHASTCAPPSPTPSSTPASRCSR